MCFEPKDSKESTLHTHTAKKKGCPLSLSLSVCISRLFYFILFYFLVGGGVIRLLLARLSHSYLIRSFSQTAPSARHTKSLWSVVVVLVVLCVCVCVCVCVYVSALIIDPNG